MGEGKFPEEGKVGEIRVPREERGDSPKPPTYTTDTLPRVESPCTCAPACTETLCPCSLAVQDTSVRDGGPVPCTIQLTSATPSPGMHSLPLSCCAAS